MTPDGGELPDPRTPPPRAIASLRAGIAELHWSNWDLWVATMPIGGAFTLADVDGIVGGRQLPTRAQFNVLATTLNEHISERGGDHPIQLMR